MPYEKLRHTNPYIYDYIKSFDCNEDWSSVDRYVFLDKMISEIVPDKKVVETGARSGCLTYAAFRHGAKQAVGFDIVKSFVEKSNETLRELNVPESKSKFLLANATEFDYSEFDFVLCVGLMYNISDRDKHKVLEKIRYKKSLIEFWCLCDDVSDPTTTKRWQNKGTVQYIPNKVHAEKMMSEHGYVFKEITPLGSFRKPPLINRYYLCFPTITCL